MAAQDNFKRNVRIATVIIIVASVVGASLIVAVSLPGISIFSPYQQYHTELTFTPPSDSYSITISANDSNIQVYQGGNNSVFVDLTVSGWATLSSRNVYITKEVTGNAVSLIVNTPRMYIGYSTNTRVYLPANATAEQLSVQTTNGNENLYGPLNAFNMSLSSTNGNIGASGLTNGTMEAATVNGNMDITAINLLRCAEDTVNGNLHLTISNIIRSGSFTLNSVNGNQDVYINSNSNATISLSTVNGNVAAANLAIDMTLSSTRTLQGTINGGGAYIDMKTSNGNLKITGT